MKINKKSKKVFWIIVGIAIAILLIVVVWQTAKISSLTGKVSGSSGKLDTTGWTENEIMNYEMHGTIPSRAGSSGASSSGSGMVGGC